MYPNLWHVGYEQDSSKKNYPLIKCGYTKMQQIFLDVMCHISTFALDAFSALLSCVVYLS